MAQEDRLKQWLDAANKEIGASYEENHQKALSKTGIQESGHGAESAWEQTLRAWLPPQYGFGLRKYVLPEKDADTHVYRETDLVIYRPGYPAALREKHEVLASGILAAFSVKLTLNKKGLREAAEEAAALRQHVAPRLGTPRRELTLPFRYGVLAHSHDFGRSPRESLDRCLKEADVGFSRHPRESLDLVCVADLGVWSKFTTTLHDVWDEEERQRGNLVRDRYAVGTSFMDHRTTYSAQYPIAAEAGWPANELSPLIVFLSSLYQMLAAEDATAEPFSSGLIGSGLSGSAVGTTRVWELESVYSKAVLSSIYSRIVNGRDPEWGMGY